MKVGVIAPSRVEAVSVAATIGFTSTAYAFVPGDDLTGGRFSALIILAGVEDTGTVEWWADIRARCEGPVYRLEREKP